MLGPRVYSVTELASADARKEPSTITVRGECLGTRGKAIILWFGEFISSPPAAALKKKATFLPARLVVEVDPGHYRLPKWLADKHDLTKYSV